MHRAIVTALRISTAVFVTSGYLALAVTPYYPPAIVLVPLLLLLFSPLGERLDRHFPFYRRITFWMSLVFLLLIVISLLTYDLLSSVTALVIYIQAYTILHQKQIRNYYHLYLMSFFLLLAACVMSPEPAIGLVMALFLVSAVVSLILLQWHGEMLRDTEAGAPRIVALNSS